jgi:hypothetical protein
MPRQNSLKRRGAKTTLRLPDLEQSKNAVLHSLAATSSQESYGHAIDEFIAWYCSEPRLAFNRTLVLRYRFFLEQKNLAPSTINPNSLLQLAWTSDIDRWVLAQPTRRGSVDSRPRASFI